MKILSKNEPELQVMEVLPSALAHLQINNGLVYYVSPSNGNEYIMQTIFVQGQPITFVDFITKADDEFFIRGDRGGMELIISLQNSISIRVDKIDEITLHERAMNVLYQPTIYKEMSVEKDMHYSFIIIETPMNWFIEITPAASKDIFSKSIKEHKTTLLHRVNSIANETILNEVEQLKSIEQEEKKTLILLKIISAASDKIATNKQKKVVRLDQKEVNKIYILKDYLISNLDKHFSVDDLIRKFNLKEYTIEKYFPALYGMTAAKLVLEYRMKKAFELLQTDAKMETIAFMIGYSHVSTFSKSFTKFSGCTPEEYKRRKNL